MATRKIMRAVKRSEIHPLMGIKTESATR